MPTAKKTPAKTPAKPRAAKKRAAKLPSVPAINAQETWLCHLILGGKTQQEAAEMMGLSLVDVTAWLGRKQVKEYMSVYRAAFLAKMVDAEVGRLLAKKITRETIAEQLLGLSLMPPERTKGNIEGQLKALVEISSILGLKFDTKNLPEALRGMSDEELAMYSATPV